jgi:hypothetical protein
MGPEILGTGFVFLERLLLRAGWTGRRDNGDCRERKNGSIDGRFHRVTLPYAAIAAAHVIYFERFVGRTLVVWCEVVRPENATTSVAGEKRTPHSTDREKRLRRNCLRPFFRNDCALAAIALQ